MIQIKSDREIEVMRKAGSITAGARRLSGELLHAGATTHQIDREIRKFIESHGATPSFLGYNGFPGSACISINDEVIHGIPGPRKIEDGDIVSIDVGAFFQGYHGDCAGTFAVGAISEEAKRLIEVAQQSFYEGIKYAKAGNRVQDISAAVQDYVERNGFSIVRDYVGHGVGQKLHELPEVPNFGTPGRGVRLEKGMTIAVEPMVNIGGHEIRILDDEWTVVTMDGCLSAHYENTILITDGEPEILTVERKSDGSL